MSPSRFTLELNSSLIWRLFWLLAAICIIVAASDAAFAGDAAPANNSGKDDVIGDTLCRLANNLSGGIARGIATLAIFSVGVGLFLGKINWGIAAATAAGVGVIFGAPKLVGFISGDGDNATCEVAGN